MKTKLIAMLSVIMLWLSACVSEPLVKGGAEVGDGTPTPVALTIRRDLFAGRESDVDHRNQRKSTEKKALTPDEESAVSYLHLLVFASDGKAVLNESFSSLTLKDGMYRIQTEVESGNGMQFYVVANADVDGLFAEDLPAALQSVATLDDFDALLGTLKAGVNGLAFADRLLMVGNETVNVGKPHRDDIAVTLHYLPAKVTVSLTDHTDNSQSIHITGWDVVNIPKKSYLSKNNKNDAVTGTQVADYLESHEEYAFETVDATAKSWTQTFYLFENRRGTRVNRADPINPADKYPGMSVGDGKQQGKAWYAPAGATCLLVYGTHTKDGQTNNVVYKIYLGENAVDDYNLFRGKHYQYDVTINGLNEIDIDTNVGWGAASFTVDKSDNMILDTHPDFRIFRIGGTALDASTVSYATVEVLETDGIAPCTWLSLSPMDLYRHTVKQSGNANQQFDPANGIGSYVRTKYLPGVSAEETLGNSTFGMTRRLTRIPFDQMGVYTYHDIMLYADALDTPDAERRATVKITYYQGISGTEVAGMQHFEVIQRGPIRISEDLYIERFEESAMYIQPGPSAGLQNTTTMQWGYDNAMLYAAADRLTNGNYLTANAVYNTVAARNNMDAPIWTATTSAAYREKFPRRGSQVVEPSHLPTAGPPYFYPSVTTDTSPTEYFHPVFNSSAARYCHEKNRDTNGDGIISPEETVWYLPSFVDMWYISQNMPAGLNLTGTYWTSSEQDHVSSWAYTFPDKTSAASAKGTEYRVRCVRGKGVALPEITIASAETDKTKITLGGLAKSNAIFTVTNTIGQISWTVTSSDPTWLKIATTATGAGATQSVTGTKTTSYYAYVPDANPGDSRTAKLTLSYLGVVEKEIEVTQNANHKGWAGCNIYWEPGYANEDGTTGRLTFDDVDETTHLNYQGVYFLWGSLVALPSRGYYYPHTILHSPNGSTDYPLASQVPYVKTGTASDGGDKNYLLKVHDPANNVGDICKYITDKGWAPGATTGKKWRMPTAAELGADLMTNFGTGKGVTHTSDYGQMIVYSGIKFDNVSFPNGGCCDAGKMGYAGSHSYYWSGSPLAGQTASMLYNLVMQPSRRELGATVRCVRE